MNTPHKENEEMQKRFDEIFPLAMFATRDYQGDLYDGELNFLKWQTTETANAKFKIQLFKTFIQSEIALAVKEERERIDKKVKALATEFPVRESDDFDEGRLSMKKEVLEIINKNEDNKASINK